MINTLQKLHISKKDRKIAGVCGGIGETYKIDSTIIRLIFIFITLLTGILQSILVYIIAWLIIPEK